MEASLRSPVILIFALFIPVLITVATIEVNAANLSLTQTRYLLIDAPDLRLHILLKGQHMQIHGQTVFDVFAKPVVSSDGTSVRYDGFATFVQEDSRFTYMLVNGVGYVVESTGDKTTSAATQTVKCLSSITPFDSIVEALNNLTVVLSGSISDNSKADCPSGNLYKTNFGGENFVVCASGASGFIAFGGDITMVVEYLDNPFRSISAPKLSDGSASCEVIAIPTSITHTTAALLTGESVSHTCSSIVSC